MKTKSFTVSIIEENGATFFNIEDNTPTDVVAPQEPQEQLFNYGWCTSPIGLYIRSSAGKEGETIGVLDNGQRFKIVNKINGWYEISSPVHGFIDAEFTEVSTDVTRIDEKLVNFTASWESFRSEPYKDARGYWTIGFGHCCYNEKPDYTLTLEQALKLLREDLMQFQNQVAELTQGLNLNQNQFNSLVDFCYNLGANSLKDSDLLQNIIECLNNAIITADFTAWSYAGEEFLEGLKRRRQAEAEMFLYGQYNNN